MPRQAVLHFYREFNISTIALLVLIAIFIALSFVLPVECSYENHLLENLEVVILFGGFCFSLFNLRRYLFEMCMKFYLACSLIFLLMIGRELSWGRVFYPIGVRENSEEIYIGIHNLWYGDYLMFFNAILICIILFCLGYFYAQSCQRNIKWNIPLWEFLIFIIMAILSQCVFEKEYLPIGDLNQMFEECTELLSYIAIVFCTCKISFKRIYLSVKYFSII